MKTNNLRNKILIGILTVVLIGLAYTLLKDADFSQISNTLMEHRAMALVAIFAVFALKPFLFFLPTAIQLAFTGILFPWYITLIINFLGMMLEMISGYFLGVFFGSKFVDYILSKSKQARMINDKYLKENFNTIFITHFVPVFPFDVISMMYGAGGTKLRTYLLPSMAGLLPRIVAYSLCGAYVTQPLSPQFLVPLITISCFSLGGTVIMRKKALKKRSESGE